MRSWKERMLACPGGVKGAAALALNSSHDNVFKIM
jgi:NhaP-type Na+/H+ or K+/H+ antiporter